MNELTAVVLVDDNSARAARISSAIRRRSSTNIQLRAHPTFADGLSDLRAKDADCVLLSASLPDAPRTDGIARLREEWPRMAIVMLTMDEDDAFAMEALQAGAQDYLVSDRLDSFTVGRAVRYAIEHKRIDEELTRLGRQNELILNSAGEGICGLDPDGSIRFANPAAAALLGCGVEDLRGTLFHDAVHGSDRTGDHEAGACPFRPELLDERAAGEDVFVCRGTGAFPAEYVATPIGAERREGAVITFKDVTDRKRAESRLQYLVDHDMLTGLFNRRHFEAELERQIAYAASYGVPAALLVLDIDNFKFVNDSLGHRAGDELIRSIAARINRRVRSTDVVARLGGDEFAILLVGTELARAREIANELNELISGEPFMVAEKPARVTTSIGVTALDNAALGPDEALVEADMAMYEAKSDGRNGSVVYLRDAARPSRERAGFIWTDRIRRALDEELLKVYAQPIVPLREPGPQRVELLVRMTDADGAIVLPGAWLPVAERFGLIEDIDAWMVNQATRLIAAQNAAGRELVCEVNLSGRSMADPRLPGAIESALAAYSIDPANLILEITETAVVANMDEARRLAMKVRELGCRFALDDFGAGFGSFYYLKHFQVDLLKIDGEFVRSIANSEIDQRMVGAMVEIARSLELQTVAEFVEDEETLECIRGLGVDFGQGYHLGRPEPVEIILGEPLAAM
jgi:diguanylate cyclase (GGDEF)-like protein/PAS domain S-box-containing protein